MFYSNYVSLCAKAKKSPSGVAREIGLSNAAANGWKNGKTPSDTTLAKLAEYFGVSVSELLGENDDPGQGGGQIQDIAQVKVALFGGEEEVTDEMWNEVLFAVEVAKAKHKRKKEQQD